MHRRNLRYSCMRSRQEESKKGGLVRIKNYIGEVSGENVRDVWRGTEFARQRVISEGIGREERHRRNKRRGGLIRQQI